ncbi:MAG: GAF domain-containing protein, partial [Gammaproteobacteria bacterium]
MHSNYLIERGVRLEEPSHTPRGFSGKILETRSPIMINENLLAEAEKVGSRVDVGEEPKSLLMVPLMIGDEARGVISLQNIDHEHAFDEGDLRLLLTLASSMSVALENARLFNETIRRASEMAALSNIGREISSTLDLPTVLERITENAAEVLQSETSAVVLLEPDGETMRAISAIGDI